MKSIFAALAFCVFGWPSPAHADVKTAIVSRGNRFEIKKVLREEGTTVVLFLQDSSSMEQQFLADLQKLIPDNPKVALSLVRLKDVNAPAAQQYSVSATPTAIVYDRFARELGRSSQPEEIRAAIRKGELMARIKWIDEDDPKAPEIYGAPAQALKHGLPGIVKTMSLRPDVYKMFNIISEVHFSDGFLKRREHEMVAAYVSALNKCRF